MINTIQSLLKQINPKSLKMTDFFSEEYFLEILSIERMRTERSHKPFLLMLINVSGLCNQPDASTNLKKVISALRDSTREIDVKGWYEKEQTVGVIFAEVPADKTPLVMYKVNANLDSHLSPNERNQLDITTFNFPDNKPKETNAGQNLDKFYPKLSEQLCGNRSYFLKRALDVTFSFSALCIFMPFFLIIAILVKTTSKGPVIFRQKRMGLGGKEFSFLKFRSMHTTASSDLHKDYILKLIDSGNTKDVASDKVWAKIKDDPRITPLGRFLRKTSLDELPQLVNVLKGDMSLVGPRPPIPYEFEKYDIWHLRRVLEIKPGITGYWQVQGRNTTTFDNMVRMDIHYSQQWSVWLDLKLLFQTPWAVLSTRGAS